MTKCKTCGSSAPHLHPAVQVGGEVEVCGDSFHLTITPQNRLSFIIEAERKRLSAGIDQLEDQYRRGIDRAAQNWNR